MSLGVPDMSVVILTPDCYQTIRKTIQHLRAQTVRDRLEIVIVAPSADTLNPVDSELQDFYQVRVVEVGSIRCIGTGKAAGVLQASAPVIAFGEDHSYPDPGWAEALIRAHQQPWAAVGPAMANANPDRIVSWINLFVSYGSCVDPAEGGVTNYLPPHNTSYKRALLLDYASDELENLLEVENTLYWDLQARGHQLYLEPAAKTYHLNFTVPSVWIRGLFYSGRQFAGARARHWPLLQRLLYIGGAPLIPLVRLRRTLGELYRRGRHRDLLPRILPVLVVGFIVSALGEMIGYALGMGNTAHKRIQFEFHRDRYI